MAVYPAFPTATFERAKDFAFGVSLSSLTLNVLENPINVDTQELLKTAAGISVNETRRKWEVKCYPFTTLNNATIPNSTDLLEVVAFFSAKNYLFRMTACTLERYNTGGDAVALLNLPMNYTGIQISLNAASAWQEVTLSFSGTDAL